MIDLIDCYLDDDVTRLIVAYVEGVNDGRALMALGQKACALRKPLLVWKGGRGGQGLRAADPSVLERLALSPEQLGVIQMLLKQNSIIPKPTICASGLLG